MERFAEFLRATRYGRPSYISFLYVLSWFCISIAANVAYKIFVASLIASAFYALVFLIIRGTIVIKGGLKFNLDPEARRTTLFGTFESPEFIGAVARSMLWYVLQQRNAHV